MTVLHDDRSHEPGTHVLLLGVGNYPFLKNGTSGKPFHMPMGMGQLSSPPVSVRKMASWFMDGATGFHNPERPLRSMQVLCSSAVPVQLTTGAGRLKTIDPARMSKVERAVNEWMARASRNPDNIAIFYFCGHGVAFGEAENSLLLEGFGGKQTNPMSDAIAFDEMRLGLLRHCEANHQIHLIDACRTPPTKQFTELYGNRVTGNPIAVAGLSLGLRGKIAPIFFAAGLASTAYGDPDKPSLFTEGLLQSMRGTASRNKADQWSIQVNALAEGINQCVASRGEEEQEQYCHPREAGQSFPIHTLRAEPEVMVKVFTRDLRQLPQTILAHEATKTKTRQERLPHPDPWWVSLSSGEYNFEALAAADKKLLAQKVHHVLPPGLEIVL